MGGVRAPRFPERPPVGLVWRGNWRTDAPILHTMKPVDPNVHPDDVDRLTGQNLTLYRLLAGGARINPRDALGYGIQRLAARVNDLRNRGFPVETVRDPATKMSVYWFALDTNAQGG